MKKKLLLKRGISLDKVEEMLQTFYQRLIAFGQEAINRVYGLLNHDIKAFTNKDCESGAWLASKLSPSKNFPWAIIKAKILSLDFTAEARTWMSIVYGCISPSGNISNILVLRAQIVACVIDDLSLNMGHFIGNEFWKFKVHDSMTLVVPSMIMELCIRAEVELLPGDTWMEPKNPIFPLKMCGEGTVVKSKKRKVDSVEDDSPMPPVVGPFGSLASELRVVKELVAKLLQGSAKSYAGPRS
ncbi:hypothetical protein KY290_008063 [Solanum tuberosum]|uniref:Putative plant transposon protein domain-containing protein n=1 Tax=Solanum tuberosum TaxID=4113 RepID=A0ABQ7W7E3_SOLTU|nr:hypothetical protein KY290_008063 [Solanum tuberosum]